MEKKKKGFNRGGKKNFKSKSNLSDEIIRNPCNCEATKHPLVNNCISCGRIVCLSEGPGPCFFCGHLVSYNDEPLPPLQLIKDSNNKPKKVYDYENMISNPNETIKLRDKLLEYDKNCASRTSVIDDECDYYQANNKWLTKEQRQKWERLQQDIQEEKHKSRLRQKLSVDFTGRVTEEKNDPLELFNKMNSMNSIQDERNFNYSLQSHNSQFPSLAGPVYINDGSLPSNVSDKEDDFNAGSRIQDKGYLEISDQGVCLSMHQPFASLLVKGIKKTESRTWYSSHRGRLWIASTVKETKQEEIATYEQMYQLLGTDQSQFPKSYPTGCLLGCVTVTDVLSQEEYNKLYPDDKASSPYIFICENPFELPMKYPIQGKHKIYKLESVIHRAALTCLEKTCLQMSKSDH